MEAIAKYDFKATADDELSFKRGDILKVRAPVVAYRAWLPSLAVVTKRSCACSSVPADFQRLSPGLTG